MYVLVYYRMVVNCSAEPASVSTPLEAVVTNETAFVEISCEARGLPTPTLTWSKIAPVAMSQDVLVQQNHSIAIRQEDTVENDGAVTVESFLTFQSVSFADGGVYSCAGGNFLPGANATLLGNGSATITLIVQSEWVLKVGGRGRGEQVLHFIEATWLLACFDSPFRFLTPPCFFLSPFFLIQLFPSSASPRAATTGWWGSLVRTSS